MVYPHAAALLLVSMLMGALPVGAAQSAESEGAESADPNPQAGSMDTVALTVEGINATSGEDNPGVVYILPWQPPTLPRRTRDALETNADELLAPMDPAVFQNHQQFQQSLNPRLDSPDTRR